MEQRDLGKTGLRVSALGLGCGGLGDLSEHDADHLVHAALDQGITLFDSARGYGLAEQRLGHALRTHQRKPVIVTKGGYGVPGVEDWTPKSVELGIDMALREIGVESLDVFLLHSCDRQRLERGDLIIPLIEAKRAGKIRAAGYSGDGHALDWAATCTDFDVLECSVNIFDQRALIDVLPRADGRGVIAKRALGNAPWRWNKRPERLDEALSWDRMKAMFQSSEPPSAEVTIRYSAFASGVSCALLGTINASHLSSAVAAVEKGPLRDEMVRDFAERYQRFDQGWQGII